MSAVSPSAPSAIWVRGGMVAFASESWAKALAAASMARSIGEARRMSRAERNNISALTCRWDSQCESRSLRKARFQLEAQAAFLQAHESVMTDHDVIQQLNVQKLARFAELLRGANVLR